jgi:DNA-binding MarR family transcriptional regulator
MKKTNRTRSSVQVESLPEAADAAAYAAADAALRLENQLCFSLYAASLAMTRMYRPLLEEIGMTYPQYVVMLALWETDCLTVGALGTRVVLDSGTLTPLLKRLEAAGMVVRRRNPEDEREVLVSLTPAGTQLRARAHAIRHQAGCASGLTAEAARRLSRSLVRLRGALTEAAIASGV